MEFELDKFDALSEADMQVVSPEGVELEGIKIRFAGPAHKQTRAQAIRLHDARQLNSSKSLTQLEAESVLFLVERIISWEGIKARKAEGEEAEEVEFSRELATQLLSDPAKGFLFSQCLEFLTSPNSFLAKPKT